MNRVTILVGDCRERLRELEADSVQAVLTSPPYWGLRSYGVDDQMGLEPTPDEYVANLVQVFREVRRVLRPDGAAWLNLGDSFTSGGRIGHGTRVGYKQQTNRGMSGKNDPARAPQPPGLKPLDLVGIPFRVAFALQADGWYLRSDVVWAKQNCMPESVNGWRWERHRVKVKGTRCQRGFPQEGEHYVPHGDAITDRPMAQWLPCPGCSKCMPNPVSDTDGYVLRRGNWRPTRSHEYIFQLAKAVPYFCDAEAVRENVTGNAHSRGQGVHPKSAEPGSGIKQNESFSAAVRELVSSRNLRSVWHTKNGLVEFARFCESQGIDLDALVDAFIDGQAECKDVWTIATKPFSGSHYAVMAPDLAHKCLAASLPWGACPECGAPWVRVVERSIPNDPGRSKDAQYMMGRAEILGRQHDAHRRLGQAYQDQLNANPPQTTGFSPSCTCDAADPVPAVALDPFGGAGTTAIEAVKLGHDCILIELNPEYAEMARDRIYAELGAMFVEVEIR